MKKLFTLLSLCFIATTFLYAQTTPPRLIASATSNFSTTGSGKGTQYFLDSSLQFYTAARTYNLKKGWLADTVVTWYNGTARWSDYVIQSRTINKYDDSGNQTLFWFQRYSYADTSWHNSSLDTFAYDAHNNLTYLCYKTWDDVSGTWQNNQQTTESYSATNNLLNSLSQQWDNTSGSWVNQLRYNARYSSADDDLADSNLFWNSSTNTWGNAGPSTIRHFTYDAAHHIIRDTGFLWSVYNNLMLPQYADDSFVYNASGKAVYERLHFYDTNSLSWAETMVYKMVYDAAGNEISDTTWDNGLLHFLVTSTFDAANNELSFNLSQWNNSAAKWQDSMEYDDIYDTHNNRLSYVYRIAPHGKPLVNQYKSANTYNGYNELLATNSYIWDTTGAAWVQQGLLQNYYDSNLSVPSVQAPACELSLYPIPATTTLNIDLKWSQPQVARLAIYDVSGRLYRQWQTPATAHYQNSIPVMDLPAGNYILVAKSGDAKTVARFTVRH